MAQSKLVVMDVVKAEENGKDLTLIIGDGKGKVVGFLYLDQHQLKKYWCRAAAGKAPAVDEDGL